MMSVDLRQSRFFSPLLNSELHSYLVVVAALEVGRRPDFEGEMVFAQLPSSSELYFTTKLTKNVGGN